MMLMVFGFDGGIFAFSKGKTEILLST